MRGLHKHILRGEVLYPAVSDTPAWLVVKANAYARANGMSPFVLYQGRWNITYRDMENEIIRASIGHTIARLQLVLTILPFRCQAMCRAEGMGIAPW